MQLPELNNFPENTKFYIMEFNVPLIQMPDGKWFNWFGGRSREFDVTWLKQGSYWEADSFQEWQKVIKDPL